MSNTSSINKDIALAVSEAAQWYTRLSDPEASEAEKVQWKHWLDASTHNQFAWQQMQAINQQCQAVPGQIAAPTLSKSQVSRRKILQTLASVAIVSPLAWLAYRYQNTPRYHAQYITAVGQIRQWKLQDGSTLLLNTDSAADVTFNDNARRIDLHGGEIFVATSKQFKGSTPLYVATPHGRIEALGTKFSVRHFADRTLVQVVEDKVKVSVAATGKEHILASGQQLYFDQHQISAPSTFSPTQHSWTDRSLVVVNMPLGELVSELSRYRRGVLSCAPDIADIKVSGAYPLGDTDRSLAVLARSFPVRIEQFSPYWVRVLPASRQH